MTKNAGKSVVKGTMILIIGNIVVKIIGALFKLPLANIIGADGMGLYNAAFNVYDIFLVITTSGYTLAITKMVAKCYARGGDGEALKILSVTRRLFFVIGVVFALIMFLGARFYSRLIGNTRALNCILVLSPAILFVSLMCAYRGYYQGKNDMIPTTISQVTEAIMRLITGLSFSYLLERAGFGTEIVAAGAVTGVTLGEVTSTSTLAILHHFKMKKKKPRRSCTTKSSKIIRTLFKMSIPMCISAIIISLLNVLDNAVVMHRLEETGCSEKAANTLYGAFNMASTVFSLPITIVSAIIVSIFPVLSFAHACRNYRRVSRIATSSMRIVMLVATAAAALFVSLSYPLVNILYFRQPRDAAVAAPILLIMGPCAILLSMSMLSTTILLSIDHLLLPSRSMIIGGAACLFVNWLLVGNPHIGIYGMPVGLFVCYLITTTLNLSAIRKSQKVRLSYKDLFYKPILPAALMAITGASLFYICEPTLGRLKSAGISLLLASCVYFVTLCFSGAIEVEDVMMLPNGAKIVSALQKLHLVKRSKLHFHSKD